MLISLLQQPKVLRRVHKILESLHIYLQSHLKIKAKPQLACDYIQDKPIEIKHLCSLVM